MGGGHFDDNVYQDQQTTRASQGRSDFEYSERATSVHPTLNPKRIHTKPFHLLESRDSVEHPISTPIILGFDVTGSNLRNAQVVQKKLPELLGKLQAILDNPQVAIWANDDYKASGPGGFTDSVQMGEFESDNRIDDTIRNIWLTGNGGGNGGESYDLLLYGAARKVITDSMEKRNKRGYMFMYADEFFREVVLKKEIKDIFDDVIEANITIQDMITEVLTKWDVYVIWPHGAMTSTREQYTQLFGADKVIILEAPEMICEQVSAIVAKGELEFAQRATAAVADAQYTNDRVE